MVSHSGQLPNAHFHKYWQRHVKTGFDTPVRAKRRQLVRREKQARLGLRPLGLLRPLVRCMSRLNNMRLRHGKGFTKDELQAVKVSPKVARTIGISFDKRRINRCQESYDQNVALLKEYMDRLVIFPLHGSRARKGSAGIPDDTLRSAVNGDSVVSGLSMKKIFPVPKISHEIEFRAPTEEEKNLKAFEVISAARRAYKPKKEEGDKKKKR